MWNAIKSDLFDFVSTLKDDTSKIVTKALGDNEEEDQTKSALDQAITDVRRSFNTYNQPVDEPLSRDFDKFLKKFSLSARGSEIGELLDVEPDVSRYYAELVPIQMTPETFWARYFFKVQWVTRGGPDLALDDEDDDEELVWDEAGSSEKVEANVPAIDSGATADGDTAAENKKLKGHVRALVARVSELETLLVEKDLLIAELRNLVTHSSAPTAPVPDPAPVIAESSLSATDDAPLKVFVSNSSLAAASSLPSRVSNPDLCDSSEDLSDGSCIIVRATASVGKDGSQQPINQLGGVENLSDTDAAILRQKLASLDDDSEEDEVGWT